MREGMIEDLKELGACSKRVLTVSANLKAGKEIENDQVS